MEFQEWIKENYLPTWYLDRGWLRNKKYFAFLIDSDDSRRIAQFFLDNQPNLDIVYNDLLIYLDVETDDEDGHVLLDYIKDTYPEIWNYKLEEYKMELKELKQQLAALEAQVSELTNKLEVANKPKERVMMGATEETENNDTNRYGVHERNLLAYLNRTASGSLPVFDQLDVSPLYGCRAHGYDCDCVKNTYGEMKRETVLNADGTTSMKWTFDNTKFFSGLAEQVLKAYEPQPEDQPTISLNKGDVVHSSTGEPIGIALEDSGYVGTGMFSSDALPYIRPDLYTKLVGNVETTEDSKPTNQPSEVVYVFRAKPDSQLHAKLIELLLEWEDDYDLLGSEVSYVFE